MEFQKIDVSNRTGAIALSCKSHSHYSFSRTLVRWDGSTRKPLLAHPLPSLPATHHHYFNQPMDRCSREAEATQTNVEEAPAPFKNMEQVLVRAYTLLHVNILLTSEIYRTHEQSPTTHLLIQECRDKGKNGSHISKSL